jgi:hypothetical protein
MLSDMMVMKTVYYSLFLLLPILGVTSCKNPAKDAGCDVNGVWLGHWQIDGGEGGTFMAPVSQVETNFEGNVFIRFDLPNLENHGVDFSGRVTNKNVRSIIEISGVNIRVDGSITNDSIVAGNFDVSLGYSGSYQGKKLMFKTIDMTEVYRLDNTTHWYDNILLVNHNLWLPDRSYNSILVINPSGEVVKNIPENFLTGAAAFDGENIWAYGYDSEHGGEKIIKYDTLGNVLDYFDIPSNFVDAIAFDGDQFYYADNYNRQIFKTDPLWDITDSTDASFNSVKSFIFRNHDLFFIAGYRPELYRMNSTGEITEAYLFPAEHVQSITTDNNGSFWCLAEEYNFAENGPGTSNYILYTFNLK